MTRKANDPKNGTQKVTNADEQEVVVNHSDSLESGYDEPVNQQEETKEETKPGQNVPVGESTPEKKKRTDKPTGEERRQSYHEEESE